MYPSSVLGPRRVRPSWANVGVTVKENALKYPQAKIEALMHRVSYQHYMPPKGSPLMIVAMLQPNTVVLDLFGLRSEDP